MKKDVQKKSKHICIDDSTMFRLLDPEFIINSEISAMLNKPLSEVEKRLKQIGKKVENKTATFKEAVVLYKMVTMLQAENKNAPNTTKTA